MVFYSYIKLFGSKHGSIQRSKQNTKIKKEIKSDFGLWMDREQIWK